MVFTYLGVSFKTFFAQKLCPAQTVHDVRMLTITAQIRSMYKHDTYVVQHGSLIYKVDVDIL
jgi:hypothetical protein